MAKDLHMERGKCFSLSFFSTLWVVGKLLQYFIVHVRLGRTTLLGTSSILDREAVWQEFLTLLTTVLDHSFTPILIFSDDLI